MWPFRSDGKHRAYCTRKLHHSGTLLVLGFQNAGGAGMTLKQQGPKLTNNDTRNHEKAFLIYFLQDINTTLPNQEWSIPNWQD